jgi:hypothetical protein
LIGYYFLPSITPTLLLLPIYKYSPSFLRNLHGWTLIDVKARVSCDVSISFLSIFFMVYHALHLCYMHACLMEVVMPKLGWRWLLALTSLPYFILLIFCSWIPESPRYLCLKGDISEAMLILERIARINGRDLPPGILISEPKRRDGDEHDTSITAVLLMPEDRLRGDDGTSTESNIMSAIQPLWSRDLIRPTVLLWLVKFAGFFAYYSIVFLISELSNGYRSCASTGVHLMQPEDSNLYIDVLVTSFAGNVALWPNIIFTLNFLFFQLNDF